MIRVLLAALLTGTAAFACAADEASAPALQGHDPVAYFTEGKPTRGSGLYQSKHEGLTYLFASEKNKALFDEAPAAYAPQYGGWCAFGVSHGKKFHADPNVFVIEGGKLYVNLNETVGKKFGEDLAGNIRKAEENWPKIRKKEAKKL